VWLPLIRDERPHSNLDPRDGRVAQRGAERVADSRDDVESSIAQMAQKTRADLSSGASNAYTHRCRHERLRSHAAGTCTATLRIRLASSITAVVVDTVAASIAVGSPVLH